MYIYIYVYIRRSLKYFLKTIPMKFQTSTSTAIIRFFQNITITYFHFIFPKPLTTRVLVVYGSVTNYINEMRII